jgi:hypothetical protein
VRWTSSAASTTILPTSFSFIRSPSFCVSASLRLCVKIRDSTRCLLEGRGRHLYVRCVLAYRPPARRSSRSRVGWSSVWSEGKPKRALSADKKGPVSSCRREELLMGKWAPGLQGVGGAAPLHETASRSVGRKDRPEQLAATEPAMSLPPTPYRRRNHPKARHAHGGGDRQDVPERLCSPAANRQRGRRILSLPSRARVCLYGVDGSDDDGLRRRD